MFESIDVDSLSVEGLVHLRAVCEEMQRQEIATAHHGAYGALATRCRLREDELRRREQAAVTLQTAVRGLLARRELAAAQELERQTKAAIKIQSLFRGFQTRQENQLGLLREEQRRRVEEELRRQLEEQARLAKEAKEAEEAKQLQFKQTGAAKVSELTSKDKADLKFTPTMAVSAPVVPDDLLVLVGRLQSEYAAYDNPDKDIGKKKGALSQLKAKAKEELDGAVFKLAAEVRAAMTQQRNALTVTMPADFKPDGQTLPCGNFFFPAGGRLEFGGNAQGQGKKFLRFHPNRSFVHVRDEVMPTGTLATAQRYLDELLEAARSVAKGLNKSVRDGKSYTFTIASQTDRGQAFTWNVIYQFSGQEDTIIHIDSGYEWSHWRPAGQRGVCPKCGKKQQGQKHRKRSGDGWTFSCAT